MLFLACPVWDIDLILWCVREKPKREFSHPYWGFCDEIFARNFSNSVLTSLGQSAWIQ